MKIKRKKDEKPTGTLCKLSQRSERRRQSLKKGLTDHFIIGDIDSVYIKGTFNVLNLYRRGMGMVFRHANANDRH